MGCKYLHIVCQFEKVSSHTSSSDPFFLNFLIVYHPSLWPSNHNLWVNAYLYLRHLFPDKRNNQIQCSKFCHLEDFPLPPTFWAIPEWSRGATTIHFCILSACHAESLHRKPSLDVSSLVNWLWRTLTRGHGYGLRRNERPRKKLQSFHNLILEETYHHFRCTYWPHRFTLE